MHIVLSLFSDWDQLMRPYHLGSLVVAVLAIIGNAQVVQAQPGSWGGFRGGPLRRRIA